MHALVANSIPRFIYPVGWQPNPGATVHLKMVTVV